MKTHNLKTIIFLSLCCDLGLLSKRLISPLANIVTDSLHIPGGIGTAFSLMFLVIAATVIPCCWRLHDHEHCTKRIGIRLRHGR